MNKKLLSVFALSAVLLLGPALAFAADTSNPGNETQVVNTGKKMHKKCQKGGHHHKKGHKNTQKQGNSAK